MTRRAQPPGGAAGIRDAARRLRAATGRAEAETQLRQAGEDRLEHGQGARPVPASTGLSTQLDQEPNHPQGRQVRPVLAVAGAATTRLIGLERGPGQDVGIALQRPVDAQDGLRGLDQPGVGGREQAEGDGQAQHVDIQDAPLIDQEIGMGGPEPSEFGNATRLEESARIGVDEPRTLRPADDRLLEDADFPDAIGAGRPSARRFVEARSDRQPGGGPQSGHHRCVRVEERAEELIATSRGTDQVQVIQHAETRMAARLPAADPGRLFHHRPDGRDQFPVARPAVVRSRQSDPGLVPSISLDNPSIVCKARPVWDFRREAFDGDEASPRRVDRRFPAADGLPRRFRLTGHGSEPNRAALPVRGRDFP